MGPGGSSSQRSSPVAGWEGAGGGVGGGGREKREMCVWDCVWVERGDGGGVEEAGGRDAQKPSEWSA